jgi:hypothetical protein
MAEEEAVEEKGVMSHDVPAGVDPIGDKEEFVGVDDVAEDVTSARDCSIFKKLQARK